MDAEDGFLRALVHNGTQQVEARCLLRRREASRLKEECCCGGAGQFFCSFVRHCVHLWVDAHGRCVARCSFDLELLNSLRLAILCFVIDLSNGERRVFFGSMYVCHECERGKRRTFCLCTHKISGPSLRIACCACLCGCSPCALAAGFACCCSR